MSRTDEMVLRFREVLRETERFGADDLAAYQHKLLIALLQHARTHVPFYRKRLDPVFKGDEPDLARWGDVPILTRAEAQARERACHAKKVPPHLGPVSADETSGSTGRPLRYLKNELMDVAALAATDRLYRWWKFDGAQPMATFVSPRRNAADMEGAETYGWRPGHLEGRHFLLDTSGDLDRHLDWLQKVEPQYLASYAAMVLPLARRAKERALRIRLKRVVARGGIVTPEMRNACREVFGATLVDQYGADEVGQIACECPECGMYHVNAEAVLVEILDDDGQPVAPGGSGRVVLTGLYNYAMPLIRYEIGDFAETAPDGHDCNIRLPALSRILGRYRNVFTLRDGRVLFPNVPMSGFRKFLPHLQIQIVQTDFDKIEVRYVADGTGNPTDRSGLETWLREGLDPCFSVDIKKVREIPRSSDGKFEDFVSLVAPVSRGSDH